MIKTSGLCYQYLGEQPIYFPDFSCSPREKLLITGPSGSGKTTLLHLLAGLRLPASGDIFIREKSLRAMKPSQTDRFRGRNIGLVFQQMHFVSSLTVQENILLQQYMAGLPQDKSRADSLLASLGLLHKKQQKIRQLSQGEQQRIAIARALINKPAVVLADEPTSSLDDLNSSRVLGLLEQMAAGENAALIVVTHDQRVKDFIPNHIAL